MDIKRLSAPGTSISATLDAAALTIKVTPQDNLQVLHDIAQSALQCASDRIAAIKELNNMMQWRKPERVELGSQAPAAAAFISMMRGQGALLGSMVQAIVAQQPVTKPVTMQAKQEIQQATPTTCKCRAADSQSAAHPSTHDAHPSTHGKGSSEHDKPGKKKATPRGGGVRKKGPPRHGTSVPLQKISSRTTLTNRRDNKTINK